MFAKDDKAQHRPGRTNHGLERSGFNLAKVGVESSNLFARSKNFRIQARLSRSLAPPA